MGRPRREVLASFRPLTGRDSGSPGARAVNHLTGPLAGLPYTLPAAGSPALWPASICFIPGKLLQRALQLARPHLEGQEGGRARLGGQADGAAGGGPMWVRCPRTEECSPGVRASCRWASPRPGRAHRGPPQAALRVQDLWAPVH